MRGTTARGALGALLTFAPAPWYGVYAEVAASNRRRRAVRRHAALGTRYLQGLVAASIAVGLGWSALHAFGGNADDTRYMTWKCNRKP